METNANVALFQAYSRDRTHMGWRAEEEELLFDAVKAARGEGRSLKSVFDTVAHLTGRKPNSIRNYYYAKTKENPTEGHTPAFVPFTDEEMRSLLTTVLSEQAKGVSVRACTLKMGRGDTRAMLRYQNKYRALIKNNPEFVREVVSEMRNQGIPVTDPYERMSKSRERACTTSGAQLVESVVNLVRIAGEIEDAKRRIAELERTVGAMCGA